MTIKLFGDSGQTAIDLWAIRFPDGKLSYHSNEESALKEGLYPIHIKMHGDEETAAQWVNTTKKS